MLFGKKQSPTPDAEPPFYEIPWIRTLIRLSVVLLVIAGLIESYQALKAYGNRVVKNEFIPQPNAGPGEQVALSARLMNRPAWLDKTILDQIFAETQTFATRDEATYDRLLNPLDKEILNEIAENYTGIDADGVNHWTLRDNAWIKKINEVRRVISHEGAGRKSEMIEIYAEYRQPAAWVQYHSAAGDKFYLIDRDFVRLPGEYSAADRNATDGLMVISNVDLPNGAGDAGTGGRANSIPEPSEAWQTEDMAAAMKLVDLLRTQPFAAQIASIDMANFRGRKDPLQPWIVLDTIWPAADGKPRAVEWGRSIGDEKFYEVSATAKIKALNEIYLRFSRIDADRDYVDIRTEQVRLPKLAAENDAPAAPVASSN